MVKKTEAYHLSIDQLQIGHYVHLDMPWIDHGFPFSSFKIKNEKQIARIRELGLREIRVDLKRSDELPLHPIAQQPASTVEAKSTVASETASELPPLANTSIALSYQESLTPWLNECEKQFARAASALKKINVDIYRHPQKVATRATKLVQDILGTILSDKEVAIQLMSDRVGGDEAYFHSLNVAILAMMLAKELEIAPPDIQELGIACLIHDIGKIRIPERILKSDSLTEVEAKLLQEHCAYGAELATRIGLSRQAIEVVTQHHERMDGSGYPKRLHGDKISPLAQIAAIANAFDNHCNRINPNDSLAPYQALAHMYSHERNWFEAGYLSAFVRCMGVYPPGTLTRLSNDAYGMVVAANFASPMRPQILIYDPVVPKSDAIILDLQREKHISVQKSLRSADLPHEVFEYLSPRTRMTYFVDLPRPKPVQPPI